MKNRTLLIRIIASLLTILLLFCGCAQSAPVGAEITDETEAEIGVVTEEVPPPPILYETDTDTQTEPFMPDMTTAAAAEKTTVPTVPTAPTVPIAPPSVTETEAQTVPGTPPSPARIAVPRMTKRPAAEAKAILDAAGISYTVTEQYSAQIAAGHVITVRFHGIVDDQYCHINPDYPVEVAVSLGYRPRTNVRYDDPKRIYLTFDDGPHPNTDRVLEILAQYDIRATFFTVGRYIAVYPDRAKAISDSGHLLACHSYSHDYFSLYESAGSVLDEIHRWEKALTDAEVPLPETVCFRFPGGTTTNYMERDRFEQIFWAVTDAGYLSFDWTCANNDRYLNNKTEEQTLTEYLLWSVEATLGSLAWTKDTPRIMLMHDVADETVEALPQILDYLIGEGYTFGTLDELDGYWVFH